MTEYKYEFDGDELHHIVMALRTDLDFYKDQLKEHTKKKEFEDVETVEGFIDDLTDLLRKLGPDPWDE